MAAPKLKIALLSLHGLIRAHELELGRDPDTGGQVKYVLELAAELAKREQVEEVTLFTRQVFDPRVDPAYAQVEEQICDGAKIVRIPFGPKRYLRKESLWPHLYTCVDQMLSYFKRHSLPDILHGHYADGGVVGAQLARLLHIPYIFTGHSLGRVKRKRFLESNTKTDPAVLDKKFKFSTRIEGEEIALETASLVVTSTNQEVKEQYALYNHYVPDRMDVIPPGVDLSSFTMPDPSKSPGDYPIHEEISRFLQLPDRPMILAMARPDERKNLEKLVEIYGKNHELQELANLVLIMGTREDLRKMPPGPRRVLDRILTLIDVYDLYGKVAYPKSHTAADVPDIYSLAQLSRGVFVNPAFTEPFGLTLLESAATGLPIIATNDGGPSDIMANCNNGLLIDPFDASNIEKALLRVLTEPKQWDAWSEQGIKGVHEYYSWTNHANRYLRDVNEIYERSDTPALAEPVKKRRIPDFDRMIICDLDNTLTGDEESLGRFIEMLKEHENVGFGIATGRGLESAKEMVEELGLPMPDAFSTSVGTELYYGDNLNTDYSWQKQISFQWKLEAIKALLADVEGLYIQPEENLTKFKLSYEIDLKKSPSVAKIRRMIREAKLRANIIFSRKMYLDIVPVRAGSEMTMRHLLYRWGFPPEHVLVAGDSGNDEGMLRGRTLGVVVGNYSPELKKLKRLPRVYFAQAHHAAGILEGIEYYHFLNHIQIPNDQV
ncbi:MAG: HAD-IIB family hydrolase [Planctomycetia bacterium]|jgi:sucrose-phosphate synthase